MKTLIVSADRTLANGHPQNLGDAFLSDALADRLIEAGHEVLVADFGDAERVGSSVRRIRVGGVRGLAAAIRSADLVVFGGGTLLQDDQPDRPFAGLPRLGLVTSVLATAFRARFAVFGCGMDPIVRRSARLAVRRTLRTGRVWIREKASAERARALSGREATVCGDVSLFLAERILAAAPAPSERSGVVVALNRREAGALEVEHVERLRERWGSVRFVSMDQGDDADGDSLKPEVAALIRTDDGGRGWQDALDLISSAELVIASRMHAMYMASMAGTPVVSIGSATKVRAFVDEFAVASADTVADGIATAGRVDQGRVDTARATLERSIVELDVWAGR